MGKATWCLIGWVRPLLMCIENMMRSTHQMRTSNPLLLVLGIMHEIAWEYTFLGR